MGADWTIDSLFFGGIGFEAGDFKSEWTMFSGEKEGVRSAVVDAPSVRRAVEVPLIVPSLAKRAARTA
jgi:hypothetical protein